MTTSNVRFDTTSASGSKTPLWTLWPRQMIELRRFVSKHFLQTKMNNNRLYCTQIGTLKVKKDPRAICYLQHHRTSLLNSKYNLIQGDCILFSNVADLNVVIVYKFELSTLNFFLQIY